MQAKPGLRAPQPSAQCHSRTPTACWLNVRAELATAPGMLPGTCLAGGRPTFHSFSYFFTTRTVTEDGVYLTCSSAPAVCQQRLAACEALGPLACGSREVIYFKAL